MEVLVSDLLTLSSIGRVVPTFKDIPSLEIIGNVTSGLEDRLKEKGIELVVTDSLPTINCDGERIYQVFENLLVNAIKFMGATKAPKIEVGYEDRGNFHQFSVTDNGIGIDPKYHQKIFEMFHRLREIEDKTGTGLGLAIVERIVKNHGGKVWVESEKGHGATFYFTLPKVKAA
jgi:signal transduction histidine kinase